MHSRSNLAAPPRNRSRRAARIAFARARAASVLSLSTALSTGLVACTNQFGPLDADYGDRPPIERLRHVPTLDRDRYAPVTPPAPEPVAQPSPDTRPLSRLDNLATAPLSLADARARTIENNLDMRVALIEPSIAAQSLRAEEAKFEMVFRPSARYSDTNSPSLNTTAANQQKSTTFGGAVDIPLRSGGRATVDLTANQQQTFGNPFFSIPSAYSTAATFSISQPLLQGAGRRENSASIRIAEFNRQISEAQAKLQIIRQLANIDRTYWSLYAARKQLEVSQSQYELAQAQLDRAKRLVDAGDAAPIELTRAEAGLAQRLEAIITAENAVLLQQRELKRTMNAPDLPLEARTLVIPQTEPTLQRYDFNPIELADAAVDNRMEMLELELQLAQDFTNIESAKNRALPDVTLDFQYAFPGIGTSLSNSVDQIRSGDFHRWTAGVSANIPLGNERAKANVQEAIMRRLQRLSTKDARRLAIRQETLGAIDNAQAAWQRILASRQSVLAAARTYQAEQRQFDAGSRTSTDVLDAATRLAEAQSSEIRAIADYQIAQVDLAFATGTILGQSQIDWAPLDPREGQPSFAGQTPGDPTPPTLPFYTDPNTRDKPADPGTLREVQP